MYKIIAFVALLTTLTFAQTGCNTKKSENVAGIANTSCIVSTNILSIGMSIDASGAIFFMDQDAVKYGDRPIRFYVHSSDFTYKELQAILQTAYATRSSVGIIYANPSEGGAGLAKDSSLTNVTTQQCRIIDALSALYCPIQSIALFQ
ncbi:MAG: hypothetical protein HUK21_04760 [Fibrobacteraceae bacterium]|nr:hypothetical protein [Fibrobacteraceae bacterium]